MFSIDWADLQLNLPIPGASGPVLHSNVGGATSRGVEFELSARPSRLDLFGAVGLTRARFDDGTCPMGMDVSGNKIPNTPAFTTPFGAQYLTALSAGGRVFGRVDVATFGEFEYDEANTAAPGRLHAHELPRRLEGSRC